MINKIPVLCTRPVTDTLVKAAREKNIALNVLSFIETAPVETVEVQQEIENAVLLSATVVFTSMNAVEAVSQYVEGEVPAWKIYCMGNTTRQLVEKYFGEELLAGTANNATALAQRIIEETEGEEVIFFCGDQRREELPAVLRNNDIEVTEVIVYETLPLPHKVSEEYLGILFFSPSAADAFFSVNKPAPQSVLFAIGDTTANTIRKYSNNKIIVSDTPGKEDLVEKMIEYFGG